MNHNYQVGDIVVREEDDPGYLPEGTMCEILELIDDDECEIIDIKNRRSSRMLEYFRPATEEEVKAYHRGIRNISDIGKESLISNIIL